MARPDKPNILVTWGDDIGIWNLSCYSHGMMGYRTPNIDRLAAEGWLPTFRAMAGEPDIVPKLKHGYDAVGKRFKVHIDGYDLLPFLTEKGMQSPRKGLIYSNDDGDLVAVRFDNWKVVFMEQRCTGTMALWAEPFVPLRMPKLFNLRTDPLERANMTSNTCYDWFLARAYLLAAASGIVEEFLKTFREYPPRQRAATFTIDQALEKTQAAMSGAGH